MAQCPSSVPRSFSGHCIESICAACAISPSSARWRQRNRKMSEQLEGQLSCMFGKLVVKQIFSDSQLSCWASANELHGACNLARCALSFHVMAAHEGPPQCTPNGSHKRGSNSIQLAACSSHVHCGCFWRALPGIPYMLLSATSAGNARRQERLPVP